MVAEDEMDYLLKECRSSHCDNSPDEGEFPPEELELYIREIHLVRVLAIFQCLSLRYSLQEASRVPSISEEPRKLLQSYFIYLRRVHFEITSLGIQTFRSLLRLAMAHASLCLQPQVSLINALFAIELMEESLMCRFGRSTLGFSQLDIGSTASLRAVEAYEGQDVRQSDSISLA